MFTRSLVVPLVAGAALMAWPAMAPAADQTPPPPAAAQTPPAPAAAQAPPQHIRGTIESVKDHMVAVKTTRGATDDITLADDAKVYQVSASDISSIKDGRFVGITSVEKDGKRVAVEVHVFDESLRGLGEGHYPWDLGSGPNMMTNANIAKVEAVGGDRVLKLDYKGGTQNIAVPPDATIVEFTAGTPDQITPGAKVFVLARPQPDGKMVAFAIVIGKDGLKPPM